jgi:hypothetical protein
VIANNKKISDHCRAYPSKTLNFIRVLLIKGLQAGVCRRPHPAFLDGSYVKQF